MSRFSSPSRAPRRGQALLLAVLIMIFAALLSASFLVVVSVNLNQTARQTDKNRASVAAQAGLSQISHQLAYSPEGDHWRSELENVPPAPGDASYSFYYTPMEIAQDWARKTPHPLTDLNGNGKVYNGIDPATIDPGDEKIALDATRSTGKLELVKSPDPRGTGGQINEAPSFLSQVERVPNNGNPDLAGALKVTVIGLSSEDPTAFSRVVAYKGGFRRSPIGQVMRTVSNYNFKNNVVPVAQVATYDATTNPAAPTLTFQSKDDSFISLEKPLYATVPTVSAMPFTITLSNPKTGVPARFVVVRDIALTTAATSTTPATYTLTLASTVPVPAPVAGERIELAATLGAPNGINYSNSVPATPVTLYDNISDTNKDLDPTTTAAPNQVDGARINGGLIVTGNLFAARLRALADSFGGTNLVPGTVAASGVIAPENGSVLTMNVADSMGGSDSVKGSDSTSIFSSSMPTVPNRESLVSDGWNRLSGVPSANVTTRAVPEFVPPTFSSGEGLNRYRNLARFSAPAAGFTSAGNKAAQNGYGQGIYIDNTQDKERIFVSAGTPGNPDIYRDMTQAELIQMWLSKVSETTPPTATNFMRTDAPLALALPGSLEQKHLRGWVGPDEFRGRGVEIKLGNDTSLAQNPIITITRDSRDDTTFLGGSARQSWKDANGTALPGVYTQILPWPTTGVIFAEGNVRLKGIAVGAPNSLTIVSMGNIYIEDSLQLAPPTPIPADYRERKILLMAKKNVVMNPTRVISRPDIQTVSKDTADINVTAGASTTIAVADSSDFRVGDVIETTSTATVAGNADCVAQVTSLAGNSITAKVVYPLTGTIVVGSAVRSHPEAQPVPLAGVSFSKIGTVQDVIQRRFTLPSVPSPAPPAVPLTIRLDIRHQGVDTPAPNGTPLPLPPVFNVKTADPSAGFTKITSPTDSVFLSNKRVLAAGAFDPTATINSDPNKLLRSEYSAPAPAGTDEFFMTKPTDDTNAQTAAFNLAALEVEIDSTSHQTPGPPAIGFKYDVTTNPVYNRVPFYYLASVGNRLDFAPPTSAERRKDILALTTTATTSGYNIPLAVSTGIFSNGVSSSISDDISITAKTTQFGFNPLFTDVSATPVKLGEDILTNDQSFYQPTAAVRNVTVDSRVLPNWIVGFNSLVLRQSEGLVGIADATNPLPDYRVMGMKIEDVDLATNVLKTGYTFNVNAYVYAQQGSWFVIPGGDYETRVRGDATKSYYDFNDNKMPDTGEWVDGTGGTAGTFDTGDAADLNRNGAVDPGEVIAAIRFSTRYNYQINFTGAIAENQTALVNTVYDTAGKIVQPGAVDDWMDKWATTVNPAPASGNPNNRIHYVFDPTVALNNFNVQDEGFKLPQTTEVFYQD